MNIANIVSHRNGNFISRVNFRTAARIKRMSLMRNVGRIPSTNMQRLTAKFDKKCTLVRARHIKVNDKIIALNRGSRSRNRHIKKYITLQLTALRVVSETMRAGVRASHGRALARDSANFRWEIRRVTRKAVSCNVIQYTVCQPPTTHQNGALFPLKKQLQRSALILPLVSKAR